MTSQRRVERRQALIHVCWIDLGHDQPPLACEIENVSATGAKLTVVEPDQVPDEFALYLTRDGNIGRMCHVRWRDETTVGLAFVSRSVRPRTIAAA